MNKRILPLLVIIFILKTTYLYAIYSFSNDSLKKYLKNSAEVLLKKDSIVKTNNYHWKYSHGNDILMSQLIFDDSKWQTIKGTSNYESSDTNFFKGFGWFRFYFNSDSNVIDIPLAISLTQVGASEIYIDGILIKKYGKIKGIKIIDNYNPQEIPEIFYLKKNGTHVIAIKYANDILYKNKHLFDFDLIFGDATKIISNFEVKMKALSVIFISIAAIFMTLSIFHFFYFLFYSNIKSNLFFSIFMFCFSTLFILLYYGLITHDSLIAINFEKYAITICCIGLYSFALFINLLLSIKSKVWSLLLTLLFIASLVEIIFFQDQTFISKLFYLSVGLYGLINIIIAIFRKVKGIWILGIGILYDIIFVFVTIIIISQNSDGIAISNETQKGIFYLISLITAILSIPLSISIFQAWGYAQLNKSLIEQAIEKKVILENQNALLEIKVTERTAEVIEQKEKVEVKNREIIDSIEYALRIQTAILPPQKIVKQYLENSFILYKPKDIVAGDFYWIETINDIVLFAACDCTGHGVPGALVSVVCHNALNRAVREFSLIQPGAILDKTAEIILENFSKSEEDIQDGMDISICALNTKTKTLQWAGANNSLVIIHCGILIETKPNKQCIGHNENVKPFTNHQFNLEPDTSIYLFTDGFADQFGGHPERKLTKKRFKELLFSIQHLPIQQQSKELDNYITNYKQASDQTDDILVIGVKL